MQQIFTAFYCLPIPYTIIFLLVLFGFWYLFLCQYSLRPKGQQLLCKFMMSVLFFLWLAAILYSTVFSRSSGELVVYRDFFHNLKEYFFHNGNKELLRTLWMNVLLFVPGGLLLEFLWPRCFPKWICLSLTVVLLTALSIGIESTQYRYALGVVEADDVLCNGLGALLGGTINESGKWILKNSFEKN